jgi:hypothetical protein
MNVDWADVIRLEHLKRMEHHAVDTGPFGLGWQMMGAHSIHKRFAFLGPDVIVAVMPRTMVMRVRAWPRERSAARSVRRYWA